MSNLAGEESGRCPPASNLHSQSQVHPAYRPPYPGYAAPYHGGSDYQNLGKPPSRTSHPSSNQFSFSTAKRRKTNTIARVIVCIIAALVLTTFLLTVLLWILFGSDVPKFYIREFSIPHFNITDTTLKANWEVGFNVKNPNHNVDISFEQTERTLVYKQMILDTSMVDVFQVERKAETTMDTSFFVPATNGLYFNSKGNPWVKDMHKERRKGSLVFEVRIGTTIVFTAGEFWKRQTSLKVFCVGVKVDFPGPTGGGTWNGGRKECMYHING